VSFLSFLQVLADILELPVASEPDGLVQRVLDEDVDLAGVPRCRDLVADLDRRLLEVDERCERLLRCLLCLGLCLARHAGHRAPFLQHGELALQERPAKMQRSTYIDRN
jgi:hypothetical protein